MDFILEEMNNLGADGVDFVPIWIDIARPAPIICSYSKEEWKKENSYPRTNRRYWKLDEHGNKVYL